MKTTEKKYIGTYKVVKLFKVSKRVQVLKRGLDIDEAKELVRSYPNSNTSMVMFMKQFSSDKYFK